MSNKESEIWALEMSQRFSEFGGGSMEHLDAWYEGLRQMVPNDFAPYFAVALYCLREGYLGDFLDFCDRHKGDNCFMAYLMKKVDVDCYGTTIEYTITGEKEDV